MSSNPRFRGGHPKRGSEASSCSLVVVWSWGLIILWIVFLFYCYHYGLIDTQGLNNVIVETENNILLRGSNNNGATIIHLDNSHPDGKQVVATGNAAESGFDAIFKDPESVHIVFSTDCSGYQDWQSLVLFHSAATVKQRGSVTRIASGCDEEKQKKLQDMYEKLYPNLPFRAHFTPDFKKDEKTNRKYDFYNKPWGLKHWLENARHPLPDFGVVALLDPDMILLRPLTPHVKDHPYIKSKRIPDSEVIERISTGYPVAQTYGLGAPWCIDNHKHFKRSKICGEGSPCLEPTREYGEVHYSVGPPYLATRGDFERIAKSWTYLVPRVYEDYPYLLAEMYAYSMAAAHERLPHLQVDHHMVSNVESGGEGWPWVDQLDNVCLPQNEEGIFFAGQELPTVAHFCQNYRAGDLSFAKRSVPHSVFDCSHPLFVNPSTDLAEAEYFFKKDKKGELKKQEIKSKLHAKRNAFMLCTINRAINAAMMDFKSKMCTDNANYATTFKF